jgi:hypothetical protein
VSTNADACPHCGRPITELRKPLLTKPAGVFVQILGLLFLLPGLAMLVGGGGPTLAGGWVVLLGIGLLWLGRQTGPRGP